MTAPGSQDDSWDELARELGVEKSTPPAAKPAPEPLSPPEDDPELEPVGEERPARGHRRRDDEPAAEAYGDNDESSAALADEADLEPDEGEEAEGDAGESEGPAGEGQPGEGQPGTGRKRRRRRRRRKKGGPAAAEATTPAEGAEAGPGDEADELPAPAAPPARGRQPEPSRQPVSSRQPEPVEGEADDEGWDTEDEPGAVPLAAEEDTGGEMLRELIANWNVPAWDEIVGGLYRPER